MRAEAIVRIEMTREDAWKLQKELNDLDLSDAPAMASLSAEIEEVI